MRQRGILGLGISVILANASAATITPLGFLPDDADHSYVSGISADGSTVIGYSIKIGTETTAFRWSKASGLQNLGKLPYSGPQPGPRPQDQSYALDVSADGTVIVGESNQQPFHWTASTGIQPANFLIPPQTGYTRVGGISADGQTIISYSFHFPAFQAYQYTEAGRLLPVGGLQYAHTISADGQVIAGYNLHSNAVRFAFGQPLADLGHLAPCDTYATSIPAAMTEDGSVIVGHSSCDNTGQVTEAFRWSVSKGLERLEGLPGQIRSIAFATVLDGKIVGGSSVDANNVDVAVLWDEAGAVKILWDLLTEKGVDLSGWQGLSEIRGISRNGLNLAGTGRNSNGAPEGFLIEMDSADYLEEGRPRLNVSTIEAGTVSITWFIEDATWQLERATTLDTGANWEVLSNVSVNGDVFTAVIPRETASAFFRLRK